METKCGKKATQSALFHLYLYPENTSQQNLHQNNERIPNLNLEIVNQIANQLGLSFTNEKETTKGLFAPIDLLDYIYIYAVCIRPLTEKSTRSF